MASWAEVTATDKPSSQGVPDQYTAAAATAAATTST